MTALRPLAFLLCVIVIVIAVVLSGCGEGPGSHRYHPEGGNASPQPTSRS